MIEKGGPKPEHLAFIGRVEVFVTSEEHHSPPSSIRSSNIFDKIAKGDKQIDIKMIISISATVSSAIFNALRQFD